jgi:hypothetical protein
MGLLAVDVNQLGIVVTSDSQKVDLYVDDYRVHTVGHTNESPIVRTAVNGFSGWSGSVGTAVIGGKSARDWLKDAVAVRSAMTVGALCESLSAELTASWPSPAETHLSIFVAGYEGDEPRFWFVSNGDVPSSKMLSIPSVFVAVNDLDDHWLPANAAPGESKSDAIARVQPLFRRGVLAAAHLFDIFTEAVGATIRVGHPQIPPLDSLERYAAYTKFRFEFAKRMYDPKYGIGTDPYPPIAGNIHVFSIDPTGTARDHNKHVGQSTVVA